ncbi:MAG: hypothetical protein M1820_009138 [Bogoriella megaspora]|nr:MAG: hypothetical protein M1820_009138 [Bogoriella megaspora]
MSTAYRFEQAKTGRATCSTAEHKKAGIKIDKGDLRMGVWVKFMETGSWKWRHWGCVTPEVIGNIKNSIDGDYELLDGLDELPEDMQDKIKRALQQGHVDDDDWLGDIEKNVPGAKGFRNPTPKKKGKKDAEADDEASDAPESPIKSKKKRGKPAEDEEDEDEEAPPAKKSKGRGKKAETATTKTAEAANTKKPRGRAKKADTDDQDDDVAQKPARAKKPRGKKVQATEAIPDVDGAGDSAEEEEAEPAPKAKRGRAKAPAKGKKADADEPEAAPKAKRGRKAKA